MDPVVHFELPAEDRDRMAVFYSTVFGWQTQPLGPEMGNYTVVTTTPTESDGRPTARGEINGGFYLKTDDPSSHAPSVVIAVDDIAKSVADVETAGGQILASPPRFRGSVSTRVFATLKAIA